MIVSRMTGKGQLEIGDDMTVTLGGQVIETSGRPVHMTPKTINGNTYTAYLDGTQIALTASEESALRKAETAIALSIPRQIARESICAEIAEYEWQSRQARERAMSGAVMDYTADRKLDVANARLADYDIAHPEEIAAIRAERAEAVRRSEWN